MASSDVWTDFDQMRHSVKQNTVDRLKQIITGFNEECGTNLSKSGKKQDIIDRIVLQLEQWRMTRVDDKWLKAKNILSQVRSFGSYNRVSNPPVPTGLPQIAGYSNGATYASTSAKAPYTGIAATGSASTLRYDPYAPAEETASPHCRPIGTIRFKDSPFFRIDQQVSSIIECPESTSAMDRRAQNLSFTLNPDHIAKLKQDDSKFQLRLFCTSSIFYTPSTPIAFRHNLPACPIEFPPTCEVRVNGTQLTANLKGLKKKPGTAPPPDLGKSVRWNLSPNRLEMVYVNSTQPVQPKKFYLVVMLVETTSVEKLVQNLQANSRRTAQDIKQRSLSYMRVNTPCRSSKCVHSQCFDATSWFSMMEQTTTYLCPTCERTLDHKDLIIDGYFDEILRSTPESVEDVIVEADGEWHTSDNKYGSPHWKATHQYVPPAPSPTKPPIQAPRPVQSTSEDKGKGSDSEDEEEGQVKRELSPTNSRSLDSLSFNGQSSGRGDSQLAGDVIDLTLSDEEEEPAPPPARSYKRSADNAELPDYHTVDHWKKNRPSVDRQQQQDPIPPNAYLWLEHHPILNAGPQSLTESRQLPPIDAYPHVRNNGAHRWP
ncbi:PINIT domain-containing protein [Ephemerocybe angulata]|uniref:PINIT domain-containing protein n=1 Tax=Ephemerocybe angulata TaxID=980116 RepID=A0A8H6ME95_9AGAR|nr:PINIT domain-containing protein [Tulosesus angulatus]